MAATLKEAKYTGIVGRHVFEPIAVETLGVFNASAVQLLNDLGRRISSISGDTSETSHYPRRARSALGVDTVLTLDVCLYVCMYVCMLGL